MRRSEAPVGRVIGEFRGVFRFLSNFVPARVILDGVEYPSIEHAFQAAKTLIPDQRKRFVGGTAAVAKRNGRALLLREDWESVKIGVMEALLRQKFAADPFRSMLLATGNAMLVEGNYWGDRFWGVCGGVGENHLGRLLMKIRAEMRK